MMNATDPNLYCIHVRTNRHRCAFTVVEFIVACAIVSIAMIGIHRTFHDLLEVEEADSVRGRERAKVLAVLDHLESVISSAVNVDVDMAGQNVISLVAGSDIEPNCKVLTCWTLGDGLYPQHPNSVALQRLRYRWAQTERPGILDVRSMYWAGSKLIDANVSSEMTEDQAWNSIVSTTIATGIDQLTINFKTLGKTDATWKSKWNGNVGNFAVRLVVKVGQTSIERVFIPMTDGNYVEGDAS